MPKHFKKPEAEINKKGTREAFSDYLNENCDFLSVWDTENGTSFLVFNGCSDFGNLSETKIKDSGERFDRPDEIDTFIQSIAKMAKKPVPKTSYKEYLTKI